MHNSNQNKFPYLIISCLTSKNWHYFPVHYINFKIFPFHQSFRSPKNQKTSTNHREGRNLWWTNIAGWHIPIVNTKYIAVFQAPFSRKPACCQFTRNVLGLSSSKRKFAISKLLGAEPPSPPFSFAHYFRWGKWSSWLLITKKSTVKYEPNWGDPWLPRLEVSPWENAKHKKKHHKKQPGQGAISTSASTAVSRFSVDFHRKWKHSHGVNLGWNLQNRRVWCVFFSKMDIWKKNMCCLWASQLSETSLGWKWTQLKKTTYECKHMGFCPGKKHTLTVWIPMYTDFWWMCLLLCFFVHFWGTKPQRFP